MGVKKEGGGGRRGGGEGESEGGKEGGKKEEGKGGAEGTGGGGVADLRELGGWGREVERCVEAVECLAVLLALQRQHAQRIRRLHTADHRP